jgi:hypothetical protein
MRRLLLAASLATLASAGTLAAETRSGTTDFGPLRLTLGDNGALTGDYSQYRGTLSGNWRGNSLEAYWIQPQSEVRCTQTRGNSAFWGTVQWTLENDGRLTGKWAYCDRAKGSGGAWNGRLNASTTAQATPGLASPGAALGTMLGAAVGAALNGAGQTQPSAPAPATPPVQAQAPAPKPAPAPAPKPAAGKARPVAAGDVAAQYRFQLGQNMQMSKARQIKGDVTCDGVEDVTLGQLDTDNPDGPFYHVMIVTSHGSGEMRSEIVSLPFDASEQLALCGDGKDVTITRLTLQPSEVSELAGDNAVCKVAIQVSDQMCDSPYIFWNTKGKPGENLLIGRH